MATTTRVEFKSFDDMAAYVLNNLYVTKRKWSLEENHYSNYISFEEYKSWLEACPQYRGSTYLDYFQYCEEYKAWQEIEPAKVQVDHYAKRIDITKEMFEALDGIWKKSPAYRGASFTKRAGFVTMSGLLKRLGYTNMKKDIEQVQLNAKLQYEKGVRNNVNRQIRQLAQQIEDLRAKHPEMVIPFDTRDLTNSETFKEE